MRSGIFPAVLIGVALSVACAQTTNPATPAQGPGPGAWQGAGGRGMGPGRGLQGAVTEVAANHYTIKTDSGDVYTINFSTNTRIMKQPAMRPMPGQAADGAFPQQAAPQMLKATDIKLGDPIAAIGQVEPATKSVSAVVILLVDPERAKQMREMQANFGKTWLTGRVTAVDGATVTLTGSLDNAVHTVVVDEKTSYRQRREPVTLADVKAGAMVRVDGALKGSSLVATTVIVMGMPQIPVAVPAGSQAAQAAQHK